MSDESDAKQILTASPLKNWRNHWDTPVLRGWRLPSRTWNQWTSPWTKQLTWLRIAHSGDWCLRLALEWQQCYCHSGSNEVWACSWNKTIDWYWLIDWLIDNDWLTALFTVTTDDNKYEWTIDQELNWRTLLHRSTHGQTLSLYSPGGSTFLRWMTSWPPSWKYEVKSKILTPSIDANILF